MCCSPAYCQYAKCCRAYYTYIGVFLGSSFLLKSSKAGWLYMFSFTRNKKKWECIRINIYYIYAYVHVHNIYLSNTIQYKKQRFSVCICPNIIYISFHARGLFEYVFFFLCHNVLNIFIMSGVGFINLNP